MRHKALEKILKPVLTQANIKLISALRVKKYRQKYRKFTVEGDKIVRELLTSGASHLKTEAVYGLENWYSQNERLITGSGTPFTSVSNDQLRKLSSLQTPNQVLALLNMPEDMERPQLTDGFAFYLDDIQDPGNLGAIWRIADWFGMPFLALSPETVDPWNPKAIQSSMGAFLRVPVVQTTLKAFVETNAPDLPLIGAAMDGWSIYENGLPANGLIAIGQEGRGLSPTTESMIQYRLTIPKGNRGGAESLNASVAAGIIAAFLHRSK